jgi:proteasome accessory factor B
VYRLSRVEGDVEPIGPAGSYDVPAGHEPRVMVGDTVREAPARTATVRARRDAAQSLRRRSGAVTRVDDEWDELVVHYTDEEMLAEELVGLGPAVVAVAPADLRDSVVRRLRAVVGEQAVAR